MSIMNNHDNGPRLDENPFDGIIQRALLHQQNVSADTARQRSVGSGYRITIEHGPSGSDRNTRCDLRNSDGVVTELAKVYASITTGNVPAETYAMMNRRQDHEDL
ncbi:MAG: hypothetical protein C4B59_08480 [Candidatus Methanogaster sp.]|uniref:Uncharacterized protein n=1 Tax=Candidatus Methanogaster sp. TaxID=3386292 RepID=A0AC61L2V1_9EURY|nr:MAG: hypothetical protein C4B59_08480 [ANME-2 cluster archaeon]